QLSFHIVPSLSPGLFIGWEGIAALGVFIDAGNNKIICSSDALVEESQQTPLLARIGTIDEDFTPVKKFDDTCDPEDDRWFHLSSAPAYRMRVRKLRPDEPRDTEEQVYCFELDLQGAMRPIDGLTHSGDYSGKLIQRLSPEEKKLFHDEIGSYTDKSWWRKEPVDDDDDENAASDVSPFPPITVFP
ncbi:hypothetical protein FOZ63_022421, partial [Perkinsus olseni]